MLRGAASALALVSCAVPGSAADATHSYLVRLGADTLALERVTRTPSQVRGEYVVRTPRSLHRTYVMDLAPDGTVRRFEQVTRPLGGPGPARDTRAVIEFLGDSARVTAPRGARYRR